MSDDRQDAFGSLLGDPLADELMADGHRADEPMDDEPMDDDSGLGRDDRARDAEQGSGPVSPELLDDLASNLLWRIGRVADDGPVTVRVGMASSAPLFQELPRLRSASDAEVETAIQEGSLRVEWVGARPKGERQA